MREGKMMLQEIVEVWQCQRSRNKAPWLLSLLLLLEKVIMDVLVPP